MVERFTLFVPFVDGDGSCLKACDEFVGVLGDSAPERCDTWVDVVDVDMLDNIGMKEVQGCSCAACERFCVVLWAGVLGADEFSKERRESRFAPRVSQWG